MCNCHSARRDCRGLWRRLCNHAIAADKCCNDLPEKNGEREIPRRDAQPDAAPFITQDVALTGRAGQIDRCKARSRLGCVIAAEINRLTHFAQRIGNRLARLMHEQRHEIGSVGFKAVGDPVKNVGACAERGRRPSGEGRQRAGHKIVDKRFVARNERRHSNFLGNAFQYCPILKIEPCAVAPRAKQICG